MKHKSLLFLSAIVFLFTAAGAQQAVPATEYGNNGTSTYVYAGNDFAYLHNLLVQPDNKILVCYYAGSFDGTSGGVFRIYRLTAAGTLDSSFGKNGFLLAAGHPHTTSYTPSGNIDLQPDGKIVSVTSISPGPGIVPDSIYIQRFLSSGAVDSSFGTAGTTTLTYKNAPNARLSVKEVKVKPNGKILVSAVQGSLSVLLQLRENGQLDRSFGGDGFVKSRSIYDEDITDLAILKNSGFVAASIYVRPDNTRSTCEIRYQDNGSIDSTTGTNGIIFNNNTLSGSAPAIKIQPDNKLLVYTPDGSGTLLLRYTKDGQPDAGFGTNGRVMTGENYAEVHSFDLQLNQKIVVSYNNQVKRYLPNGQPDSTFGTGGVLADPPIDGPVLVAVDSNRLYVLGTNNDDAVILMVDAYNLCNTCGARVANNLPPAGIASGAAIRLYPNPATNVLTITGLNAAITHQITITDYAGNVWMSAVATQQATATYNVSRLKPGNYVVSIRNGATVSTVRFVKQ